jgi:hypothetical protein
MLFGILLKQNLFLIGLYILITLLIATEIGYRLGFRRNRSKDGTLSEKQEKGVGTITSAMLALVAFVMAIAISMADTRFDLRRKLVLKEANAIGTASLRAQAVGGHHGQEIMRLLGDYTQHRLDFFGAGEDPKHLKSILEKTEDLKKRIWKHASDMAVVAPNPLTALLLTSLNQAFDLATEQRWAFAVRVPVNVFKFLHFASLLAVAVMGFHFSLSGNRHFVLSSILLFALTAAILLIVDLDKPRSGEIMIEQAPLYWTLESLQGK